VQGYRDAEKCKCLFGLCLRRYSTFSGVKKAIAAVGKRESCKDLAIFPALLPDIYSIFTDLEYYTTITVSTNQVAEINWREGK